MNHSTRNRFAVIGFVVLWKLCKTTASQHPHYYNGFMNPYPRFRDFNDGGNPGNTLFLTSLIHNKSIPRGEIREQAKVIGTQYHGVESYSGLLTVDPTYKSNMFFWYFPSEEDPTYSPVVLWLQGGPGASSLFGLFAENGPFHLDDHVRIQKREYTWSRTHNMIFIDNPVGSGFSFTEGDEGYAKNEKDVAKNLHEAIQQLYELFEWPSFCDFWITGESYAGKYIPALAYQIYKTKNARVSIPLLGMAIGNGFSDPIHQLQYGDYLYQLGLIDEIGMNKFQDAEAKAVDCITHHKLDCALDIFESLILGNNSLFTNLTGFSYFYNYLYSKGNHYGKVGDFIQSSQTRRSIHVGNLTFHDSDGENKVQKFLKDDFMESMAPWIGELLKKYHICFYNGQLDIVVGYPLTRNFLSHLKFDDSNFFKIAQRHIWLIDDEVAGYFKHAGHLTEVMIRNAGHMAPADQPKWVYNLIHQLTHYKEIF